MSDRVFDMLEPSYLQNEAWFLVERNEELRYTLVINSYGRLRKLFDAGGYEDLHDGGYSRKQHESSLTDINATKDQINKRRAES